jgi:hypothetical protein
MGALLGAACVWVSSRATSEMPAEPAPAGDSTAGAPAKERRDCKSADCAFQAAAPKAAYSSVFTRRHERMHDTHSATLAAPRGKPPGWVSQAVRV